MAKIESHRDLIVWQKTMDLTVEVYRLTSKMITTIRMKTSGIQRIDRRELLVWSLGPVT